MPTYFDFEITLREIQPPIWRRFLLRQTLSFQALHNAIQDACGWTDSHLFCFYDTHGKAQPMAEADHDDERQAPVASTVRLSQYFTDNPPQACLYLYDYGDHWAHDVVLRGAVELPEKFERRLLGGGRNFPPEDCGGIPGYERIVEFRRSGIDIVEDDPQGLATWLGKWQPEDFNLENVKRSFDR